ncbi:Pimeloyl-ACP methyl ester carboxylesterase [Nocardioides terrae]|uniref:Pimeloyl-ACP methyl ester carboxylesterase n=1 Tax=Nocardioides terrae TaxID=574651 RepID=A0A1I1N2X9_9ACTN|nr:alpha/beta fold hydrolase [Nocardioides terrae]SFC91987.1 Pimeloyl-ACP methyl ester carboxylesterase [Nocardioides terrae]
MSTTAAPSRRVLSTDGVALAVYESGDAANPTVVAVHGYPDDHTVWDGVVALLADDFHVVTYDVRGAGQSEAPRKREGYRISQLVDDLAAVLDATAPDEKVHLLAHDWGSIQSWGAVTDPRFADRLADFTSVSGPSLDMAADWLRRVDSHPLASLRQLASSYYIGVFQAPFLPEALVRAGILDKLVSHSAHAGGGDATGAERRPPRDLINGLELYRANLLGKMARPAPGRAVVPVQVLAPTHDPHVTSRLQREAPAPYVDVLVAHEIPGNHWVVAQRPELVVQHLRDFIAYVGS